MADENERKASGSEEKGRRFRLVRKVKSQGPPKPQSPGFETREEKELRDLAAMGDDADRGTPEQDASLREGCMSMVRVVGLFFVVMFASIIATWCIKR
jgi:hypothetical protein